MPEKTVAKNNFWTENDVYYRFFKSFESFEVFCRCVELTGDFE